jgi:hypothetical protein
MTKTFYFCFFLAAAAKKLTLRVSNSYKMHPNDHISAAKI